MAVPFWQPGQLYQPGDLVRPTSAGDVEASVLQNPGFESGDIGWTFIDGGLFSIGQDAGDSFEGAWRLAAADNGGPQFPRAENNARIAVTPGQAVTAACMVKCVATPDDTRAGISISWFASGGASLGKSLMAPDSSIVGGHQRVEPAGGGLVGHAADNFWTQVSVTGVAPSGAATFTVNAEFGWHPDGAWRVDAFTVDFAGQTAANPFLFRAVQAEAGFSGNSEPDWPGTLGLQVVDNEVTWEAVASNNVVWEARRTLVSGASEPTFPTGEEAAVADNTISWVMDPRRVRDTNAPRSKIVAIAASKVFAGDADIVPFSETTNCLNWTTEEDAGYLPTGLQTHGSNPVAALGLYRSNMLVFNAEGFQMWQVDEDPQNMALLDSGPIGTTFHRAGQPVSNDWVLLTNVGIRNISIAGASTNLQAGFFGKAIDPLVKAAIAALGIDDDPLGLFHPGTGQYWCIFGNEAFVLTMNGGSNDMNWSTYTFPSEISDWTILDGSLYLRSGDLVWRLDDAATVDDAGGTNTAFLGELWWHYIDSTGSLGQDGSLEAFELVIDGACDVQFGFAEDNEALVTPAYTVNGDTLPGTPIPMPLTGPSFQLRLTFAGNQAWEWYAAKLIM